jgi:hypothetical protein
MADADRTKRLEWILEGFSLLTGFMIISSPDLPTPLVIDPMLRLVELRAGLAADRMIDCLEAAYRVIGPASACRALRPRISAVAG